MLFILSFAYVQSIYSRITVRREVNAYTFTPEGAFLSLIEIVILFFVINFFLRRWQVSSVFTKKEMVKIFGISLFVYMGIMQLLALAIAIVFNNVARNFNQETFTLSTFTYLLDGFIYGSFFLVYYYYHKNKKHQEQLFVYNQTLADNRINQLKTQLNPHFLFNNLNVLDQLIEEDKDRASNFLNEFAEIYRYVLQATDKKVVLISEELDFVKQYFKLVQHKYGNAYQLKVVGKSDKGYIVPLTLQLLIENALQHNLGTVQRPVCIKIEITADIHVSNNRVAKRNVKPISGRALKNLEEQYKLLANEPIKIKKTEELFLVVIPIISTKKHD